MSPLLLTLLPIVIILGALIIFRMSADISGIIGWLAICVVSYFFFSTSIEVLWRSTLAGLLVSLPVSMIVAASLLQMAFMEKTGALKRIIIFIKTIARDHRAVQIMLINIGFGTLMVSVGATPVSILPPILLAMGYSTYVAIALPAIGYDSLCTYALLGAPIVVFVGVANKNGVPVTLSEAGSVFFMFLPVISTLIGFCMLWIVGRWKAIKEGLLPCLITGGVIGIVAWFTNKHDNLVVLTGVLCGLAVILVMSLYLKIAGKKVIDKSQLSPEELQYAAGYSLWKAFTPWALLIILILILNLPKDPVHLFGVTILPGFKYLFGELKLSITSLTPDKQPIDTRAVWQAYTWIFVSTILAIPFLRPTGAQLRDTLKVWLKRAPRPVFAAAIFFAIGEVMRTSGIDIVTGKPATRSMVKVLADSSADFFQGAYGSVVSFIGLFGGFITGSEASTIAMFGKYVIETGRNLHMALPGMIIITAGLAFGGGLASVISPAKLQNAAASIDKIGEEGKVIRTAFVFSLILTAVTAVMVVVLLKVHGM